MWSTIGYSDLLDSLSLVFPRLSTNFCNMLRMCFNSQLAFGAS
jgi:hypothetical protein